MPPSDFHFQERGATSAVAPSCTMTEIQNIKQESEPDTGDFVMVDNIDVDFNLE